MFVALLAGGYLLLQRGRISANVDGKLNRLELWVAHTSLRATLRHQAPEGPDPLPLTNGNLIAGIRLYRRPPQLASDGVEGDPLGYSFWKIKHGIRLTGMSSFKGTLTDQQI